MNEHGLKVKYSVKPTCNNLSIERLNFVPVEACDETPLDR